MLMSKTERYLMRFAQLTRIDDIMKYTKTKQIPGLVVAFDFEKAFDSLSWSFLFKALNSFKFGKSSITWVSVYFMLQFIISFGKVRIKAPCCHKRL